MGGWDGLMMAAVIELAGLTQRYGATVGIQQLDLEVEAGEVFGFLGPNGAGKTTTFNDGDFEARQAGEDVGLQVWAKAKTYFNGKAIPKTQATSRRFRLKAMSHYRESCGHRRAELGLCSPVKP